jgi:hypothetical protein
MEKKAFVGHKLRGFTDHKQTVTSLPRTEEQGLDEIHPEPTEIRNIVSLLQLLRSSGYDLTGPVILLV